MRELVVAQYLLTFREVLEAALLTAIILAYLVQTRRTSLARYAWYGVFAAIAAGLLLGVGIWFLYGSLSPAEKVLFEGVAALLAVAVLTSMIIFMAAKARGLRSRIEGRVEVAVTQGAMVGLAALTFVLVFREGLETVLFLTPFLVQDVFLTLVGAALGVVAGVLLAYGVFRLGVHLDLRRFFFITSILLILLAGGLLGYGVHELIRFGDLQGIDLGAWGQSAYVLPFTTDHLLHHENAIGSLFAVMFGYAVAPEWARVVAHGMYLALALPLVLLVYGRPEIVGRLASRVRGFVRSRYPGPGIGPQED